MKKNKGIKITEGHKVTLIVPQGDGADQPYYRINFVKGLPSKGSKMSVNDVSAVVYAAEKNGSKIEYFSQ